MQKKAQAPFGKDQGFFLTFPLQSLQVNFQQNPFVTCSYKRVVRTIQTAFSLHTFDQSKSLLDAIASTRQDIL